MRSEKLTFENKRGERLSGRLDVPADGVPVAYALFAHCFTCTMDLHAAHNISRALTSQGIAVFHFDFTGLGESEGTFEETTFSSNVDDLEEAADFLEQAYEAPKILIGHSLGGAAVLQAAIRVESVSAVATIGAPYDPEHVTHLLEDAIEEIEEQGVAKVRLGGRSFTIQRQFLEDLRARKTEHAIRNLKRSLLVFHSPLDQVVGIENAADIFEAARHPKSFVSLDEADHFLVNEADAQYVGTVLAAWARKYINAPQEEVKAPQEPGDNRICTHTSKGSYRTDVLANGHSLVSDEPAEDGGTNAGPTPYELLAAALGACTSMTLHMYAEREGWPLEAAAVYLRHQKIYAEDCARCEAEGGRIDRIEREVELVGPLDEAQKARLLEIAERCPVDRTLKGEIDLPVRLAQENT